MIATLDRAKILCWLLVLPFGCSSGPESVPRSKVTSEGRTQAGAYAADLEKALESKDLVRAEELATRIDETDPYTPRHGMAVARARAAIASRDGNPRNYNDAIKRADDAIAAAPDDPDLLMQRAQLQFDRKYYDKAIDDFTRAVELRATERQGRRMIAFCRHHLRQPKLERKAWEDLVAVAPDDADALYYLAAVLLQSDQKVDVALGDEYLKKAIEKVPTHRLALEALAYRAFAKNDYAAAEGYLKRALSIVQSTAEQVEVTAPTEATLGEADVNYSLGAVLQAAGRTKEAAEAYERCLTLDPTNTKASANLGLLLLDLGDVDQGMQRLREASLAEKNDLVKKQIDAILKTQEAKIESERNATIIPAKTPTESPAKPPGNDKG